MRKLAMVALALMAAGGLAACSESVDKEGTIDEMVEQGIPREAAECIVDDTVDALGEDRALELNDEDPTDEEAAELDAIYEACFADVDLSDISIPDVSIPDISIPDISIPE